MASQRTKKFVTLNIIFTILHILCLVGPFLYFLPTAFIGAELVSKIALSATMITSIILAAMSMFVSVKHRMGLHRSILWILVLGLLTALTSIKPFICIMSIVSICDELIFVPIRDRAAAKASINKEIDLRSEV